MHVAVFCRDEESEPAQLLRVILTEKEIAYTVYSDVFFAAEEKNFPQPAVSVGCTHVFYLTGDASLLSKTAASCFAAGKNIPVRAVSKDDYASPDFLHFLDTEKETSDKNRLIAAAREELIFKGIPVLPDFLGSAVERGNRELVDLFFAAGFSPDTKNSGGVPLLCLAVRSQNWKMVYYLLESGADVNLVAGDRGYSALMDAVAERRLDVSAELLARHADPNIYSVDGQTALILAVGNKDSALVKLLLANGADPDKKDKLGMSARAYAELFHKADLIQLFANV